MDAVDGIVLFGSYLTNFLMDTDNKFGLPALTLVGTLDGLTLSYVYRYQQMIERKLFQEGKILVTFYYGKHQRVKLPGKKRSYAIMMP
jgi:hypothetical protein